MSVARKGAIAAFDWRVTPLKVDRRHVCQLRDRRSRSVVGNLTWRSCQPRIGTRKSRQEMLVDYRDEVKSVGFKRKGVIAGPCEEARLEILNKVYKTFGGRTLGCVPRKMCRGPMSGEIYVVLADSKRRVTVETRLNVDHTSRDCTPGQGDDMAMQLRERAFRHVTFSGDESDADAKTSESGADVYRRIRYVLPLCLPLVYAEAGRLSQGETEAHGQR